jgi:hypothetical protein
MMKARREKLEEHVKIREMRNAKWRPLERSKNKWKFDIKMYLK